MLEEDNTKRGKEEKKGLNLKTKKENTIKSLKEVEYFLYNWKKVLKGVKLYKILQ